MTPYLLIIFFATSFSYLGRLSGSRVVSHASLLISGIILVAFAGFRDYRIGTDTGNYVYIFSQIDSLETALDNTMEVGYNILTWLAKLVSESYASLLSLIAAVVVYLYISTIARYVKCYEIGIYIFIALGSYTFLFNGARQAIAGAICFWAIRFVLDRRMIPYVIAIIVAMFFHKTAAVALPLYFLASSNLKISRIFSLIISSLIFIVFARTFVDIAANFVDDRFSTYGVSGEGGGNIKSAFLVVQGFILLWFRRVIKDNNEMYTRLLNIYIVGLIPVVISLSSSLNPSGLLRLSLYFSTASILMWPMIFLEIRRMREGRFIGIAFFATTMVFFILTTTMFSNLTPFDFNADIIQ